MWRHRDIHRAAHAAILEGSPQSVAGRDQCDRKRRSPSGPTKPRHVSQSVTFALGQATVTAKYKDVGSIRLQMKDPAALPSEIRGSTNSFVVKPAQLAISRVETLVGVANPGAATAIGAGFRRSRNAISRRSGRAWIPKAASPRAMDRESSPEGDTDRQQFADRAGRGPQRSFGHGNARRRDRLRSDRYRRPIPQRSRTFSTKPASSARASVADGDYLGGGAVASAPSGNVGRFPPARFALAAGKLESRRVRFGFTYMDQARLGVHYRLEARETGGGITQNYDTDTARTQCRGNPVDRRRRKRRRRH